MSLLGVLVAALSAKFIVKEDLKYRQFGVVLFAVSDSFSDIIVKH